MVQHLHTFPHPIILSWNEDLWVQVVEGESAIFALFLSLLFMDVGNDPFLPHSLILHCRKICLLRHFLIIFYVELLLLHPRTFIGDLLFTWERCLPTPMDLLPDTLQQIIIFVFWGFFGGFFGGLFGGFFGLFEISHLVAFLHVFDDAIFLLELEVLEGGALAPLRSLLLFILPGVLKNFPLDLYPEAFLFLGTLP